MVSYVENLDLFEDYPRAVEDVDFDTDDLLASYKRYSVPHINDIIFRMSCDADFYAMLDPQSAVSLSGNGKSDFVVEPEIKSPAHDYPVEAAEIDDDDDEDWYSPHPDLDAVLPSVGSPQLDATVDISSTRLGDPDVPFDAAGFPTTDTHSERLVEDDAGMADAFDIGLSLLFPDPPRHISEYLERRDFPPHYSE